jgi:WhiB family redox-sensing transcriptional regulator
MTTAAHPRTPTTPAGEHWQTRGACRDEDPELFQPLPGQPSAPAKAVCRRCPVEDACRAWALRTNLRHGVAGGLSAGERETLLRGEHRAAVDAMVGAA